MWEPYILLILGHQENVPKFLLHHLPAKSIIPRMHNAWVSSCQSTSTGIVLLAILSEAVKHTHIRWLVHHFFLPAPGRGLWSAFCITVKSHHLNALLGRPRILMIPFSTAFWFFTLAAPTTNCHEFEQITSPSELQFPYLHHGVVEPDVPSSSNVFYSHPSLSIGDTFQDP